MVATDLVSKDRQASAIAIMFTGLTVATVLGVPLGTWLGQSFGWRTTFWAVTAIGVIAMSIVAALVPADHNKPEASDWRADLRVIASGPVLLGLLTTVLGYAGVFAVFTYVAPLLTEITGFPDSAVSPILLVFGGGMMAGNLLGGRLADGNLARAIVVTLAALALVLGVTTLALHNGVAAVLFACLLGAAGFATVAPLQMWVLSNTKGAGQSLASSFNIGAFNLGNAIGAWVGGLVIDHGPGLAYVPLIAAVFPFLAIALALAAVRSGRTEAAAVA